MKTACYSYGEQIICQFIYKKKFTCSIYLILIRSLWKRCYYLPFIGGETEHRGFMEISHIITDSKWQNWDSNSARMPLYRYSQAPCSVTNKGGKNRLLKRYKAAQILKKRVLFYHSHLSAFCNIQSSSIILYHHTANIPDFMKLILQWKVKVTQSCLTLCNPMVYTVHGVLQAGILEWVAFPFSRGSSQPRDQTQGSCIEGGFFTS